MRDTGRHRAIPEAGIWGAIGAIVGFVLAGPRFALVGACCGLAAHRIRHRRRARATVARADEQLADAVSTIAAAIRSGRSVPQAISFAAAESPPPLREPLRELDRSLVLGSPFDEAVTTWTRTVGSGDARLLAGVLSLHRRSGGDLPSVLDGVASTIRERQAAAREIRALTAQARLSGTILGVLPFGFFAFLWLTSRSEIEAAMGTPAGLAAVGLGLALEGAAYLWIRRLLEVR